MTTNEENLPVAPTRTFEETLERIRRGAPPYVPELDDCEDPPLDTILRVSVDEGTRHRVVLCPTCGEPLTSFRMPDDQLRATPYLCEHVEALYSISSRSRSCTIHHDEAGYLADILGEYRRPPAPTTLRSRVAEAADGSTKGIVIVRFRPFPRHPDHRDLVIEMVYVVRFDRGWGPMPSFIKGKTDFGLAEERLASAMGPALPEGCSDVVKAAVLALPPPVAGGLAELPRAWERLWRHLFQVPPYDAFEQAAILLTESTGVVMTEKDVKETAGVFLETWWNETVVPHLPRALPHLLPFERDHSFALPENVVTPWLLWECLGGRDRLDLGAARNVERYRPGRGR